MLLAAGVGVEVWLGVAVKDGDTIGVDVRLGDTVGIAEGVGAIVSRRDGTGDTERCGLGIGTNVEEGYKLLFESLCINGDTLGDTEVTLVTLFNVTDFFSVTIGVTMSLGDISGEILALPPKNAKRLPPYPGP